MPARVPIREAARLAGVDAKTITRDVLVGRLSRGDTKAATIDLAELKKLYPNATFDLPEDEPVEAEAEQEDEPLWYPSHLELQALWRLDEVGREVQKKAWCKEHPHLVEYFAEIDEPPVFTPPPPTAPPSPALQNASTDGRQGWFWLAGLGVVGLFILSQCVNRPGSTPSAGQTTSATSAVVTQPTTSAYAPAPAQTPPPERCEDKAVVANASLGGLICNDQDLLSLNNTDKALHEERIQTEGESRRGKIETDRAALEGLMATCGAFGPQRDCLIKMLSGDIAQLRGLIAADRGQTAPSTPSGDSSVAPSPTLPPGGTVVAPAMNDPAWSEPVRLIPGYRFNSTLPNGGHAYALCHVISTGNWVDCANLPSLNGSDYVHYKSADPNNPVIVGYSYSPAGQN